MRHPLNSVDHGLLRAALVNLDLWVSAGVEPPPSKYPRLADGTAARPEAVLAFFRSLPGVRVPAHVPGLNRMIFGPESDLGVNTLLPPARGIAYRHFVSAVDGDGNEVAGIRSPDLTVPLATYTGWNVRHPDAGTPDEILLRTGATLTFARTAAERNAAGDPRPSIEERYVSKKDYLEQVRRAAAELVAQRYLLEEDVEPIVERSALRWDLFTAVPEQSLALAAGVAS